MLHARLLTYLDEVVRQGSIRKAAERLNVSASAISRQILALEETIGTPLFDRSGRRLMPTAAGELLVRHVRETMREMGRTQRQIEELRGLRRGSIGVGLMSGLAANLVPRAMLSFRERNPRVELKLRLMASGEEILDAVARGDVDLGLGFDFPRRPPIRIVHAAIGRLGAVMSPDHPLAGAAELRLADCAAYPLTLADGSTVIRPYIDQAFERSALEVHPAAETNSIEILRHMAMIGNGITFLTQFDIQAERQAGRLVHIPVRELARRTQRLMLVENERRANALADLFAERLKVLVAEAE